MTTADRTLPYRPTLRVAMAGFSAIGLTLFATVALLLVVLG